MKMNGGRQGTLRKRYPFEKAVEFTKLPPTCSSIKEDRLYRKLEESRDFFC
jgi:hypothetical protein